MKKVIVNDSFLKEGDIDLVSYKTRAILLQGDKLLIGKYAGVILLPGGKLDKAETVENAIVRELKEELGVDYTIGELKAVVELHDYQKDYPSTDNKVINKKVVTRFYIGKYKGIELNNVVFSENEKKNDFKLELVSIKDLNEIFKEKSNNPRKKYFDRELQEVLYQIGKL